MSARPPTPNTSSTTRVEPQRRKGRKASHPSHRRKHEDITFIAFVDTSHIASIADSRHGFHRFHELWFRTGAVYILLPSCEPTPRLQPLPPPVSWRQEWIRIPSHHHWADADSLVAISEENAGSLDYTRIRRRLRLHPRLRRSEKHGFRLRRLESVNHATCDDFVTASCLCAFVFETLRWIHCDVR